MNNKTFSQQTIDYANGIKATIINSNVGMNIAQMNNIAALFALGAAAAHTKIIRPNKTLKFSGVNMLDFFREVSIKINAFGDDEAKKLVTYATFNFNPNENFDDGIYGVTTNFSVGVTYYFNEVKGKKHVQNNYYYEDKNKNQYVANIQIV